MSSRAFFAVVILALTALFFLATPSQACTTLLVGKLASVDGSVMATHSNDGEANTDPRLVKIPARVWPKDSKRPVYPAPEGKGRGDCCQCVFECLRR